MASAPTTARWASFTRESIAASGLSWDETPSSDSAYSGRRRARVGVIAAVVLRYGQGQGLHRRAADGASPAHFHRRYPLDDFLRLHRVAGRGPVPDGTGRGGVSRTTYR